VVGRRGGDARRCRSTALPKLKRTRGGDRPTGHLGVTATRGFLSTYPGGAPNIRGFPPNFRGGSPTFRGGWGIIRGFFPANRGFRPILRGFSPANRGFPAIIRGLFPPNRDFFPTNRGFFPSIRGFFPANPGIFPSVCRHFPCNRLKTCDLPQKSRPAPVARRFCPLMVYVHTGGKADNDFENIFRRAVLATDAHRWAQMNHRWKTAEVASRRRWRMMSGTTALT